MSQMQILSNSKPNVLHYLRTIAVNIRTDSENPKWKSELRGRQIALREIEDKIVAWIDKIKGVGGLPVDLDPVHASLPLAELKFLIVMAVAESQQMDALLTGVKNFTDLIGRCQMNLSISKGSSSNKGTESSRNDLEFSTGHRSYESKNTNSFNNLLVFK
ncbi:hypothetical protein MMC29_006102 [Sticta canariensis]|nr:hypothetical protein [Sticta canariensis]